MARALPWMLVTPGLAAITIFLLLPLGATVATTFNLSDPFGSYAAFFADDFARGVLIRTMRIALIVTVIAIMLGLPAAAYIARCRASWRSVLIVCAVFPLLTGTVVRSFAWIAILGRNGIVNEALVGIGLIGEPLTLLYTEFAIISGLVYLFTPLMILSLVGVLENIDRDLMAASRSLGATPVATFFQVTLPLAVPGLIVGSVLVFTGSFTAYTTPLLLGGQRNTVLATFLYREAMVNFDWAAAGTIAVIMMVATVTIVLAMGRLARRLNPEAG